MSDSEIELSQHSLMEELRKGFVKHDPMHFEPEYAAKQKPKSRKRKKVKEGEQVDRGDHARQGEKGHHGTQANTQSSTQGNSASSGHGEQDNTDQIIEGGIEYLENVYAEPNLSLQARVSGLGFRLIKEL